MTIIIIDVNKTWLFENVRDACFTFHSDTARMEQIDCYGPYPIKGDGALLHCSNGDVIEGKKLVSGSTIKVK